MVYVQSAKPLQLQHKLQPAHACVCNKTNPTWVRRDVIFFPEQPYTLTSGLLFLLIINNINEISYLDTYRLYLPIEFTFDKLASK